MLRHAFAAWLITALLAAAPSAGQTAGTATGSIIGTVRDTTGAVVPNLTIAISSDAIMGGRTTSTGVADLYAAVAASTA